VFETNIVVVGNVLTAPEWRRTASTNALVANFRVASTARRMDRETGRWVDGNHFRVRVNCWRKLAEGVASSITVGDPVVVAGRLYTRDWTDAEGNLRTTYEMEAMSVGHDLSRGRSRFFRNKPAAATSAVETAEAEGQIRGEAATLVPEEEAPAVYGDGVLDGDEPTFADVPATSPGGFDPAAALRGGTIEPFDTSIGMPSFPAAESRSATSPDPADPGSSSGSGTAPRSGSGSSSGSDSVLRAGSASSSGSDSVPRSGSGLSSGSDSGARSGPASSSRSGTASRADSAAGEPAADEPELEISVEAIDAETGTRRGRGRGSRRQPVPA
jgi:single-strand DNA-binding protein